MATLNPQSVHIGGLVVASVAASGGGDSVAPSDTTALLVKNGGGSPVTVTVVVPGTEHEQNVPDVPVTVAAGAETLIGPLTADLRNPSTGLVDLTYSAVTSVNVAAIKF